MMATIPVRFIRAFAMAAACVSAAVSVTYAQDAEQAQADFIARMVADHGFGQDALEALFAELAEQIMTDLDAEPEPEPGSEEI